MNKIISLILSSFLLSNSFLEFQLDPTKGPWVISEDYFYDYESFPKSNGIIDIESFNNNILWMSTGAGLGFLYQEPIIEHFSEPAWGDLIFSQVNTGLEGGNPALFVNESIIIVSGVISEYVAATDKYEPKGTGISYSINNGIAWDYMPQPIDASKDEEEIIWGDRELKALAVTTDINNVSYDVGMHGDYVYAASWAGGLRRFKYEEENPSWEIVPLPLDSRQSLYCDFRKTCVGGYINGDFCTNQEDDFCIQECTEETEICIEGGVCIDIDQGYLLNPRDPDDGGNHNHKGFSVLGTDEYLWVGTANGINRGTLKENDCIEWFHQTTVNSGLKGDWIIGIEYQEFNDKIWAITWSSGLGQRNSLAYTYECDEDEVDEKVVCWEDVDYFTEKDIEIYNLTFNEEKIYVASEEGIFYSDDGVHFEKINRNWVDTYTGDNIVNDKTYSIYVDYESDYLFIGTGDGLVIKDFYDDNQMYKNDNRIYKFDNPASSFSAYPNPFFINYHSRSTFSYLNPRKQSSEINIYDFNMNHVIKLNDFINRRGGSGEDYSFIYWDGTNEFKNKVVNGVYFCKLTINNASYWTKLLVVN